MKKTIIVTGGAGFIGANLVHLLYKSDKYRIVNVDALTYAGNLNSLKGLDDASKYVFEKCDVADKEALFALFDKYQPEGVFHLAAESHVDRSIEDPGIFLQTNIMGTATLMDACRKYGIKRYHQVSTDEVYGDLGPNDPKFNELSPYRPSSPYSASKAAADHLVRAYYRTYNLPVTISNCSNNYGPYQYPEKIIPLFITNLIEDRKVPLYGQGSNIRDWIHVDDHNAGLEAILLYGRLGETYCLGGDHEISNLELAKEIISLLGKDESYIEFVADRPGHDWRYSIDFHKAKEELGWEPHIDFISGLESTVRWYQEHEAWWRSLKN